MGNSSNVQVNYKDQSEFDRFFATAFDKYDRNRDGKIDYKEYQPLVNEMLKLVQNKYGTGPTYDKLKQAWSTLDKDRSGYLTRSEFSTRAKKEVEKILAYAPQAQQHGPTHGAHGPQQQQHHGPQQHHGHH